MTDNINKLFFQNINGLVRIFNIKNINFKLIITPINNSKHKIIYHFIDNILAFPNNIYDIGIKFKYLVKNLSYIANVNDLINFNLEIYEINKDIKVSSELTIYFKEFLHIDKYIYNKNNISDEAINNLLEHVLNNIEDDDEQNIDDYEQNIDDNYDNYEQNIDDCEQNIDDCEQNINEQNIDEQNIDNCEQNINENNIDENNINGLFA
jgi:hypothetical protein